MPTFIDVYCGCGGLSRGFADAGWTPVLGLDADADCIETYRANFGEVAVCADVADVDFSGMDADAIVAGVPCQGFLSLARRNHRRDARNGLFRHVLRALDEIRPPVFALENVPAFLDWWSGRVFVREAKKLGYEVEPRVLNAADYGVAQFRKRAFIVGSVNDGVAWPTPRPADERRTVRDSIGDLPHEISWRGMNRTSRCRDETLERIRSIPVGGSRKDLPRNLLLPCWRGDHAGSTDVLGRLRWDSPSVSIRTEFIKPEKGRYVHPEADRPITLREGARLQSFPDDFRFRGSMTSIARQIGNAVPPGLALPLAAALR